MLKKIMLTLSVCVLFAAGVYAQDDTAKTAKAEKTEKSVSASETSKPAAFRPTKDQIKKGQEILIAKKLWDGEATGVYGDCRPAIKEYQKANGLEQNGKFDKPTLAKMGIPLNDKQKGGDSTSSTTKSSSTSSSKPIFRATEDQIRALQIKLKEAKLFTGDADGKRSDELKAAVRKYREANGLTAGDGINAATLEKAGIALTDKQKESAAGKKADDKSKED